MKALPLFAVGWLSAVPALGPSAPGVSELDRKIGQMIMVGFRGTALDPTNPVVEDIRKRHIGGIVLFDVDVALKSPRRNIESEPQLARLVEDLQAHSDIPLFVAIDQEGGRVNRLKERFGFRATRSAASLGARPDCGETSLQAGTTAGTLARLGININFAPVVDLAVNPDNPVIARVERAFSADPAQVIEHARAWVNAHRRVGVASVLKHFPGHGSSRKDSHLGFVDVSETWTERELEPYRVLIGEGECDGVMTAHIFNANLDPEFPATLSQRIVEKVLRQQLKFDGVVFSDDLQMKAITDHFGFEAAVEAAVRAGIDVLLFGNNTVYEPDVARRAIDTLRRLVSEGRIYEARIEQSFQRIQRLKSKVTARGPQS